MQTARWFPLVLCMSLLCLGATEASALEDFYVCTAINGDGDCQTYMAVLDGLAALEQIGITPDAVGVAFAWGFGAVIIMFGIGLGLGTVHRAINSTLKGDFYA